MGKGKEKVPRTRKEKRPQGPLGKGGPRAPDLETPKKRPDMVLIERLEPDSKGAGKTQASKRPWSVAKGISIATADQRVVPKLAAVQGSLSRLREDHPLMAGTGFPLAGRQTEPNVKPWQNQQQLKSGK